MSFIFNFMTATLSSINKFIFNIYILNIICTPVLINGHNDKTQTFWNDNNKIKLKKCINLMN